MEVKKEASHIILQTNNYLVEDSHTIKTEVKMETSHLTRQSNNCLIEGDEKWKLNEADCKRKYPISTQNSTEITDAYNPPVVNSVNIIQQIEYRCSECGKDFDKKKMFFNHIRIHRGEKPYMCSVCGRGFNCKCYLTIHERQHNGERPFHCIDCGKMFC
ncbi:zinc finger protein 543-like [Bombina bombina]|uniref:zinc finger protein 543-like n=1 Tax=Bombina bombina TaxID=8345 RepID=UPI00235AFF76|nr:zinc finger protein 543-like [Bombina bombina]